MKRLKRGFTLVELLVVLAIVLLASLVALPAIYSSLNGRQVTDGARILSGALVGMRDSAIRYNTPRGLRFLPDPVLTIPAPGLAIAGETQLVYNRMIPIEPAGDYSAGRVSIGPQLPVTGPQAGFPPRSPRGTGAATQRYPFQLSDSVSDVLMVEESPYANGFVAGTVAIPNEPTSWYWNVRLGDKIKLGSSGRAYTIVGPCVVNPWNDIGAGIGNAELFVNVGAPGTASPLTRTYYLNDGTVVGTKQPEFLFLVNSEDDNLDGYIDSGWDGFNNDGDAYTDEADEWETEAWPTAVGAGTLRDTGTGTASPSAALVIDPDFRSSTTHDVPYIISRRPVPSPGAREVMLPTGIVIDATTWNGTRERSRIPVTPGSLFCDIMVDPSGAYIPTTEYSSYTSASADPAIHFWVADRSEVHPVGTIWKDATGNPTANPNTGQKFILPMTEDTPGYITEIPSGTPSLKADRRLVTMFKSSGLIVTNTIESIPAPTAYLVGEGFNITSVDYPFLKAQQGMREAR